MTKTVTTSWPVWEAVSQWLSPENPDLEYWWKLTGPQISHMMLAAGYSTEAQYNALLFHYRWIVGHFFAPITRGHYVLASTNDINLDPLSGSRPTIRSVTEVELPFGK